MFSLTSRASSLWPPKKSRVRQSVCPKNKTFSAGRSSSKVLRPLENLPAPGKRPSKIEPRAIFVLRPRSASGLHWPSGAACWRKMGRRWRTTRGGERRARGDEEPREAPSPRRQRSGDRAGAPRRRLPAAGEQGGARPHLANAAQPTEEQRECGRASPAQLHRRSSREKRGHASRGGKGERPCLAAVAPP